MRVAVMQPYFLPYAGYFRLFAAVDQFIVFDCVQFPRRGWVHRNRFPDASGAMRWLTLPLCKGPRDMRIADLAFREDAADAIVEDMRHFPALARGLDADERTTLVTARAGGDVVEYLLRLLGDCCSRLGLPFNVVRSSALELDPDLRGGERIRAAMAAVGATEYVNAPGGRALYSGESFSRQGLSLQFLAPYTGPQMSILHRLLTEPAEAIAEEIREQTRLEAPDD